MNSTAFVRLFLGLRLEQEEKVDIRARCERIAAITADGGDREAALLLRMDVADGEVVENGDDLILQPGNAMRAIEPAALFGEQAARLFAAFLARLLQQGKKGGALVLLVLMELNEGLAFRPQRGDVENGGKIDVMRHHARPTGILFIDRGPLPARLSSFVCMRYSLFARRLTQAFYARILINLA